MKNVQINGATIIAVVFLLLSSCIREDLYQSKPTNTKGFAEQLFDFSTTQKVQFKLNYQSNFSVFFSVYSEYPLSSTEFGLKKDIKPIFNAYTDKQGLYNQKVTIPAIVEKVYVYSTFIGVPQLMIAKIEGGVVTPIEASAADYSSVNSNATSKALSASGYGINNFYTLGRWDKEGVPTYLLKDKMKDITPEILESINSVFTDQMPIDKKCFAVSNLTVKEDATINLYFLDENAGNFNTLFYYCYDTAKEKNLSLSKIQSRLVVAFPNAKKYGYHSYPFGVYGALSVGQGIALNYYKNGVNKGTKFPAGTSVGWVLASDAYSYRNGSINPNVPFFYSNNQLNPETSGEKNHVALFKKNGVVVMGFEDTANNEGDGDCNDVVFNVSATPMKAIDTDIPDLTEKKPTDVAYTNTFDGILAFEDNWPYKGDYDMNDVMVKYHSVVSYNFLNEVISVDDEFKLLWSGAIFENGFGYEMNVQKSNAVVEVLNADYKKEDVHIDQKNNKLTLLLANNIKQATNKNNDTPTYRIKTTFKQRIPSQEFTVAPYNPFILVQNKLEVHLPNYAPSGIFDMTNLFGTADDYSYPSSNKYYLAASSYPFAINIVNCNDMIMNNDKYESRSIDLLYPKFKRWAESKGVENKDWYKYPKN